MTIKKRILTLTLAVLLVIAMAIPASAASRTDSGTYYECNYSTHTSCYSNRLQCVMEYSGGTGEWTNYAFQIKVIYFYTVAQDGAYYNYVESPYATRITSIYQSYDSNVISDAMPAFYVNQNLALEYSIAAN